MSHIITTDNGNSYSTPGFWPTTGAVLAGSLVSSVASLPGQMLNDYMLKKLPEISQGCDKQVLRSAINDAFISSGLKEKGVKIIDVNELSKPHKKVCEILKETLQGTDKEVYNIITDELPEANQQLRNALKMELPKVIRNSSIADLVVNVLSSTLERGENAAYLPNAKAIGINIDKIGTAAFHEMGHAINANNSLLLKSIQKLRRPLMLTSGLFAFTALFKRKKVEGEQPVNAFDKATTFIKNNVGKLVFVPFVPIIAEELVATYRGNKMAGRLLPSNMLAKVKKGNRLGALTYISAAVVTALTAFAASKTRDAIAKPKLIS